jgi:hypothetical protein
MEAPRDIHGYLLTYMVWHAFMPLSHYVQTEPLFCFVSLICQFAIPLLVQASYTACFSIDS